ncbi:MAG: hypothetical protein KBD12_02325 [Candidatus Pacebacteria bacterium]|nr:hypothetical protein [Candidatus Paceibacterota bacterium]
MKKVFILFVEIKKNKIKRNKKSDFLNSKLTKIIPDLEIELYDKFKNLNYTIRELLNFKKAEIMLLLRKVRHLKNLYTFLNEYVKNKDLNIDLKKYPLFKDHKDK